MVRAKPPLPAIEGLFGRPTVVNNVLTLGTVPAILARIAGSDDKLIDLRVERPSLEERFLELTNTGGAR